MIKIFHGMFRNIAQVKQSIKQDEISQGTAESAFCKRHKDRDQTFQS